MNVGTCYHRLCGDGQTNRREEDEKMQNRKWFTFKHHFRLELYSQL